ncbi:MAG: hypothetical protein PHU31_06955, partial [Anaerotignum sp.]|nr:hypothetical protein [Anaerotignum sp.]
SHHSFHPQSDWENVLSIDFQSPKGQTLGAAQTERADLGRRPNLLAFCKKQDQKLLFKPAYLCGFE